MDGFMELYIWRGEDFLGADGLDLAIVAWCMYSDNRQEKRRDRTVLAFAAALHCSYSAWWQMESYKYLTLP